MIVTELVFLLLITIVNAIINRCYLCSQDKLAECIGNNLTDLSTVLQYYTEPCNGQCVLFRNANHSIIRGCSWTYGHMIRKPNGWHEITPGVQAYFCDRYLCNNGTYDQPEKSKFIFLPEQLYLLAANNPSQMQYGISGGHLSRELHQCYSCTARFQGCGEFLDPHYASKYIRSCPTSCIIFRNPNDLNLITRDCGIFWPQVQTKSGFHKLLGSDAFFCQESLCNGISFDFVMGIFHNQLPTIIKFPLIQNISITTTNSVYNDSIIWDDSDLDDESTTSIILNNSTTRVELIDKILPNNNNNTIIDDLSNLNETLFFSSTIKSIEENNWNTSSIVSVTRIEYLSVNDKNQSINHTDKNLDNYISSSTTSIIDLFTSLSNETKTQLIETIKPISILDISPFSLMLTMDVQNFTTTETKEPSTTTIITPNTSYEYCKDKQCHHGGRLTSDCLCICLPTFTGDNCETAVCEEEPADICAFILEHECEINSFRYLCPKFCQIDICSSNKI